MQMVDPLKQAILSVQSLWECILPVEKWTFANPNRYLFIISWFAVVAKHGKLANCNCHCPSSIVLIWYWGADNSHSTYTWPFSAIKMGPCKWPSWGATKNLPAWRSCKTDLRKMVPRKTTVGRWHTNHHHLQPHPRLLPVTLRSWPRLLPSFEKRCRILPWLVSIFSWWRRTRQRTKPK